MTTSNAAVDSGAEKAPEKASDKVAERRRALGRGLESLLPGPRVVAVAPAVPPAQRTDSSSASNASFSSSPTTSEVLDGRAGTPVAPSAAVPGTLEELQAVAVGRAPDGETVFLLQIELIDANPHQTRTDFDEEALRELRDSIRVQGVLQPIVVRPGKEGRFILILGERRLRASKWAQKTTIPAIVKRVSDQQAAEMTVVENLQRQDLGCLEQANAFARLSQNFSLTQEEIGKRVGISREQVSNYLRLLKLPSDVYMALSQGALSYSHARVLLSLRDETQISRLAQLAIQKQLSVRVLDDMVLDINVPSGVPEERKKSGARWVDPNVRAAQRSIETVLGMKVRIKDRRGKGKITIEYGTLEDFDRVVLMLKGK